MHLSNITPATAMFEGRIAVTVVFKGSTEEIAVQTLRLLNFCDLELDVLNLVRRFCFCKTVFYKIFI